MARDTKKLHDVEVDGYLHDSVMLMPETIHEEYARVAADLAYCNKVYASAYGRYQKAKMVHERTVARLRLSKREEMYAGGLKATESMVEAAVMESQEYEDTRLAMIEAEVDKVEKQGWAEAVRAKMSMTQSLGAYLREEMGGDSTQDRPLPLGRRSTEP